MIKTFNPTHNEVFTARANKCSCAIPCCRYCWALSICSGITNLLDKTRHNKYPPCRRYKTSEHKNQIFIKNVYSRKINLKIKSNITEYESKHSHYPKEMESLDVDMMHSIGVPNPIMKHVGKSPDAPPATRRGIKRVFVDVGDVPKTIAVAMWYVHAW